MRTDSCRTCGRIMKEFQRCSVCSEINRFICTECRKSSDEQVHVECGVVTREVVLH